MVFQTEKERPGKSTVYFKETGLMESCMGMESTPGRMVINLSALMIAGSSMATAVIGNLQGIFMKASLSKVAGTGMGAIHGLTVECTSGNGATIDHIRLGEWSTQVVNGSKCRYRSSGL